MVGEKIYSVQIVGKCIYKGPPPPLTSSDHKFLHVQQPLPINFPQNFPHEKIFW